MALVTKVIVVCFAGGACRSTARQPVSAFAATQEPAQREVRVVALIRRGDGLLALNYQLSVAEGLFADDGLVQPFPRAPLLGLHLPDVNRIAKHDEEGM